MLDFNIQARQRILVTDGHRVWCSPRRRTSDMRVSLKEVRGLAVIAILLLDCSAQYVSDWRDDLENRYWLNEPIDIVAVRKSKVFRDKHDAILLVNRRAGQWQEVARLALGRNQKRLESMVSGSCR